MIGKNYGKKSVNHMQDLLTEGDVNFSNARKDWYKLLDIQTANFLEEDAGIFLHQALSTPCLEVLESAEGIYITGVSGKKYMDFHGNSVHQVGYGNQYVLNKVKNQMDRLAFSPRRFTNTISIDFAKKLTSLLPKNLNRILFAPGGTSSIGMALKLVRVITGKNKVVSIQDSFHGASLDAIGVGGEYQFKKYMGKLYPENVLIPQPVTYNHSHSETGEIDFADALEQVLIENDDIGAFIAETIRNTDVQIPSKAYWKKVRNICNRYNVLLILDEIPIAFGRTGKMFAFEHYGIEPDILCLGKGLGAGVIPIAAMITKDEYNIASDISLGHYTHEKSPLGAAAGIAMLEYMEQNNLLAETIIKESYLKIELNKLKEKYTVIGDIRGIGLLWGIELVKDHDTKEKDAASAEKILYYCLNNGLSFKVSQGNVLQLCPPLTISLTELNDALKILDAAFNEL